MVKFYYRRLYWLCALLCFMPSSSQAQTGLAALFRISPAVCVAEAEQSCALTLNVEWSQTEAVCLFRTDTEQMLGCGKSQNLQLKLELNANLVLQLRSQSNGAVVQQKVIRRMQQLDDPNVLTQRRLSWDLF